MQLSVGMISLSHPVSELTAIALLKAMVQEQRGSKGVILRGSLRLLVQASAPVRAILDLSVKE